MLRTLVKQASSNSTHLWKLITVVLLTGTMVYLVCTHASNINGPWYWKWLWRRLPAVRTYGLLILAGIPVLVAAFGFGKRWMPVWLAIVLLMIGSFGGRMTGAIVTTEPMSVALVHNGIVSPAIGSYWTAAAILNHEPNVLAVYPEAMPQLEPFAFHAANKPPGPVLYHLIMIRMFGYSDTTAIWCGIGLGLLATFSIPMMYWFARVVGADQPASLLAAAFLSLCPGFILFFPMTDPVYPIFTSALSIFWFKAIKDDSWKWSVCFALALALATFITYNFLVIGVFFAGMIWLTTPRSLTHATIVGAKHACIVAVTFIVAHIVFFMLTRYDPIATFQTAYRIQNEMISRSPRSHIFPQTIPWDLYDFLLGAGWIAGLLVMYWIIRWDMKSALAKVILLGLFQIVLTAGTGLLQAETARVWNFLYPLLLLPVGVELSKWKRSYGVAVLICLLLLTAAIQQNMTFLDNGVR